MTFLQSILLGIIQGITEFLPISSSAHLVLVPYLLKWTLPAAQIFPFDVLVQLGTLAAVILYFWKDIISIVKSFVNGLINKEPFKDPLARSGWYLIIATIPAGILGLLIKSQVEAAFSSPHLTALFLFVTAALLILADFLGKRTRQMEDFTWLDALWMGLFQGISIFPGISRSGSTIAGGMTRNLDRTTSARFSFLMSIPVMLGAGLVSFKDLANIPDLAGFLPILLVGFFTALIVGYLSIHWLLDFIKRNRLWYFAVYCVLLACIVLIVSSVRSGEVQASSSASGTPAAAVPASLSANSDLQIIRVQYSSSLSWLVPTLSSCANLIENTNLVTQTVSAEDQTLQNADILLRWGAPADLSTPSYQIGNERLVVVVNSSSPLQSLPLPILQKLFAGEITTWGALHQTCPDCFSQSYDSANDNQQVGINFYSSDEDIQKLIMDQLMNGQPIAASSNLLVPNPEASAKALASNSFSIGILPAHDLNTGIKEVNISGVDAAAFENPILAITPGEPQGKTLEWLTCVQKVLNP